MEAQILIGNVPEWERVGEAWDMWNAMVLRCYQYRVAKFKGFTISEEWKDFGTFREWFKGNHFYGARMYCHESKVYGPETTTFVSLKVLKVL